MPRPGLEYPPAMIYPRDIVEHVRGDDALRARFPHVAGHGDPLHVVADPRADPELAFERWMISEGWRQAAPVRRYLHFLRTMVTVFKSIEQRYPGGNRFSTDDKDALSVQTSVDEMLAISRTLYYLVSHDVPGDVLECGCFKGYSSCCLSWACACLGRKLIVADSFQGLPDEDGQRYYREGEFKGAFEEVVANVTAFGRPEAVEFLRGFFADSLPGFDRPLCLLWMDVDLQSSTVDVLTHAFDRVQPGAAVFSHELFDGRDFADGKLIATGGPARALDEFYRERSIPYRAVFCEGCLGLTVPGATAPLAFSRERNRALSRGLALQVSVELADHAETGTAHAVRRSLRRLRRVPVLGSVLGTVREMTRRSRA